MACEPTCLTFFPGYGECSGLGTRFEFKVKGYFSFARCHVVRHAITQLQLTAHIQLPPDGSGTLCAARLGDRPAAFPALEIQDAYPLSRISDVYIESFLVHFTEIILVSSVLLEGAPFGLSDPLARISTSEVGSVGECGAPSLSTTMNWRKNRDNVWLGWDLDTAVGLYSFMWLSGVCKLSILVSITTVPHQLLPFRYSWVNLIVSDPFVLIRLLQSISISISA